MRPRTHPARPVTTLAAALVVALLSSCAVGTSAEPGTAPTGSRSGTCTGPATAVAQPSVTPIGEPDRPDLPVTYTDVTGDPVTITDTSRILAVDSYGTLATTVHALGLGDQLVGRDISTGLPELAHLPVVTHNGHELNGEAVLDLDPTVILTDYSIGPLEVQLQLRDSGIPVVIMSDNRSRDQIGPQIEEVATVLGVPETGRALAARVEAEVAEVEASLVERTGAASGEPLRMAFLYVRGAAGVYYWFGEGSGAADLIESLGGIDVAGDVGLEGMRPVNAEGLVKARPELFLMMSDGLESVGGVDGLLELAGVADTDAGLNRCVIDMSDHQILSFGPQFPHTLASLADAIYGPARSEVPAQ